mgnify:CR=1 FL=1
MVTKFPVWLPPNVITLVGFACNMVSLALMFALYGSSTEGPVDGWFCVFVAVMYFIATTLDNCDGKQARRTKSGSPLGMLFDHGLDACTAVICNICL